MSTSKYEKVLVTGATGFVGSRLCERLKLQYKLPYRAFVRNFTNAARIARMDAEMVSGDLNDPQSIRRAIDGCDAVIHLAHSEDKTAPRETKNLLAVCMEAGIKKFVHMSSMAVYGPNPKPECAVESTAVVGRYGEAYSDSKAAVEHLVQDAVRRQGFPAAILRPTIIFGPYSPFVLAVIADANNGEVSLIDGGSGVCNAVYIDDVCDATYAALHSEDAVGKPCVICADHAISWKEFILAFANMVTPPPNISNVSSGKARQDLDARPTLRSNIRAMAKLVMSPEFRDQVAAVPLLRGPLTWARGAVGRSLSQDRKRKLKKFARNGEPAVAPVPKARVSRGRLIREVFRVEFSNGLAKQILDWRPVIDFESGAAITQEWLAFARYIPADQTSSLIPSKTSSFTG